MARAAIYSMISLGVRNIFICNRTLSKATSLAQHYNNLISEGKISELSPQSAMEARVRVLESFASSWPTDARQPSIVVCCIPRQSAGEVSTGFSLPDGWLKSPTGGVVLEVCSMTGTYNTISDKMLGCVSAAFISNCPSNSRASSRRMEFHGWLRCVSNLPLLERNFVLMAMADSQR